MKVSIEVLPSLLAYLLTGVDELLSEIPHLLTDMGEIWCKRSGYISVEHL